MILVEKETAADCLVEVSDCFPGIWICLGAREAKNERDYRKKNGDKVMPQDAERSF
jgi:hypothetical protein